MKNLLPNASSDSRRLNPHLFNSGSITGNVARKKGGFAISPSGEPYWSEGKSRMNRTESEFALILEAMKQRGEILRYEYEGITLRWQGVRYTPDFVVFSTRYVAHNHIKGSAFYYAPPVKLIEIKGAFTKGKFERAIERFRHARTYWPEFAFELHQKTKQGWKQIL